MLDTSTLIDNIITCLRSNTTFVATLANQDPTKLFPYYRQDSGQTNLDQAVQEQPRGTAMVAWMGTRLGSFNRNEAIKHDFAIFLKPIGKVSVMFVAMLDGICTAPNNAKFRFSQVNVKVNPVESINLIPQTAFIGAGLANYDMMPVTFTLTERGVDS